jgi:hypothetical protein
LYRSHKYHIIFIDDFSRHTWIYFIKYHSEVLFIYNNFYDMIHTHFDTFIRVFHADSAGEYLSDSLRQVLGEQGTLAQFSCPGAHAQNGVAKRKHRHLLETTRALMIASSVSPHFWAQAIFTVTYLINIQPSSTLQVVFLLSVFVARRPITPAFIFFVVCAMCFLHLVSALS